MTRGVGTGGVRGMGVPEGSWSLSSPRNFRLDPRDPEGDFRVSCGSYIIYASVHLLTVE